MYTWFTSGRTVLPGLGAEAWLMYENLGSTLKKKYMACPDPAERVSHPRLRTTALMHSGKYVYHLLEL
jgi:hypothetical protein